MTLKATSSATPSGRIGKPTGPAPQGAEPQDASQAQPLVPLREERIFAFLCREYVQSADKRQRRMGLQYMEAETHDLARKIDGLFDELDGFCKHGFADRRTTIARKAYDKLRVTALAKALGHD